jgi:hypothetical protein
MSNMGIPSTTAENQQDGEEPYVRGLEVYAEDRDGGVDARSEIETRNFVL